MTFEKEKSRWLQEEKRAFAGWDFSYLAHRWQHEPLGWDYRAIIKKHLTDADRLLDMGTGGGEFLLTLEHPYANTAVTEAWVPNIALCKQRLEPLGVAVHPVMEGAPLPMGDSSFDIIINRHEDYCPKEVRRVLKPKGLFITQQVGGENCISLIKHLNSKMPALPNFSLQTEKGRLQQHGFVVEYADEGFPKLDFYDVGAIVFWAKNIPWSFPGFSVEQNAERLWELEQQMRRDGVVGSLQHRFVLVARNNK